MKLFSLLAVSFSLTVFSLTAQDVTGSIVGTVMDPSQGGVPGASVTFTNTDRNAVVRSTTTSGTGEFSAPLLPIGRYSVAVEAKGFKKSVQQDVVVNVNDRLTLNFNLEVGDVQQQVVVESGQLQVELQTAAAQDLISGTQVRELALNTRNYEQLVTLMPGVVFTGIGNQLYLGVSNPFSGASNAVNFAMNGGRTSQNNWTIDGADNVDRGANLTLLNYPSIDAIAEFKVLRGEYSAEFGRNASGSVNVVTKSGTNALHGDAYEFFRNDKIAANNFFNNSGSVNPGPDGHARVPPLRYNNFGYTVGGPVYIPKVYNGKNKTFFFFSQEFRRVVTYGSFISTLPTAAEKQGIFPVPVCVSVTSTGTCAQTSAQVTNINPVAAAYIKDIYSKVPDAPASNLLNFALRNVFNARQELYRVDHVFNAKWSVFGRFINDSIPTIEPRGLFTAGTIPGVSDTTTNSPGKGVVAHVTGSITPTILNEFGYAYSYGAVLSDPTGLDVSRASPDIKPTLPYSVTLGRIPTVSFSNALGTLTGYGPYRDYSRNHNWFDNLSKIRGKHTIKAGVTVVHYNKQENQATNNVGTFTFAASPAPAGATAAMQAWANFLTGTVTNFSQSARDITPSILVNQTEMYVQDDYRVRPNLTVNIGLRYSLFRQATDGNGYLNNFDPAKYDPTQAPKIDANGNLVAGTGNPLNGLIVAGKNSPYGSKATNENNGNVAPRFGFAWDPFGDGKTSIRSGYGMAYDFTQVANVYESVITSNPTSVQTISINNTGFQSPGGSGTVAVAVAPPGIAGIGIPWKTPYMQQYSFDVQHEFRRQWVADMGYFGSKGTHLIGEPDINEVLPGLGVAAGLTNASTPFNRTTDPKLNQLRPYLGYSSINTIETWFNSKYNSLQISLKKRFGESAMVGANYTWSKFLTNSGTDVAAPMNVYNRQGDYGISPYNRTQVFTANWNYELPWLKSSKGFLKYAAAGWQLSGIVSIATGLPFNESDSTVGLDPGGLGYFGSSQAGSRGDQVCNPNNGGAHTVAQWFNTACFANVPTGVVRPGNAGRNTIFGPGYQNWDMSAMKNFHFTEARYLQLRGEFFNIANHTNFATIIATRATATYGQVTATRDPRIVQLALKLYF